MNAAAEETFSALDVGDKVSLSPASGSGVTTVTGTIATSRLAEGRTTESFEIRSGSKTAKITVTALLAPLVLSGGIGANGPNGDGLVPGLRTRLGLTGTGFEAPRPQPGRNQYLKCNSLTNWSWARPSRN